MAVEDVGLVSRAQGVDSKTSVRWVRVHFAQTAKDPAACLTCYIFINVCIN